jgi:predicted metalloprotease with PDZ domain
MSFQAPFVDASTSIDPVNRENTFISYYSYGSVLGLALDLSLREKNLNLDDYMKLVWQTYGKGETPYTIENLQQSLKQYAGKSFSNHFFNTYIYTSGMPNYKELLISNGVLLQENSNQAFFGATAIINDDLNGVITTKSKIGSPAYRAGLDKGDVLTSINNEPFPNGQSFDNFIKTRTLGDSLQIDFERYGVKKTTLVVLKSDPSYNIVLMEKEGAEPSKKTLKKRYEWLKVN